jgi:hypothetical protein
VVVDNENSDGFCGAARVLSVSGSNVIFHNYRHRLGLMVNGQGAGDALMLGGNNIVFDHCSFSWSHDEMISILGGNNHVFQWCIFGHALEGAGHPESQHGFHALIRPASGIGTMHHNLLTHGRFRNPLLTGGDWEIVNNVIYNYGSSAVQLGPSAGIVRANIIGNMMIPGLSTTAGGTTVYSMRVYDESSDPTVQGYIAASEYYSEANNGPPLFEDYATNHKANVPGGHERDYFVDTRLAIVTQMAFTTPAQALIDVLAGAGARNAANELDSYDAQLVLDVQNGTGVIGFDDPADVGGYPDFS